MQHAIAIRTFNGADRLKYLLPLFEDLVSINFIKEFWIIEDKCPNDENHEKLVQLTKQYPRWRLLTSVEWVNMQGTAQLAMESIKCDFIYLISDDVLFSGDPFYKMIKWIENIDKDLLEVSGAIGFTHYDAIPDMLEAGLLPYFRDERLVKKSFYLDPENTWMKKVGKIPLQLNGSKTIPSIGRNIHGTAYCLSRKAWEEVGGYDPRWHADDQCISYKIWLQTNKIVYTIPTDPFYHCGGMAQASDFYYERAVHEGLQDRCEEVFGRSLEELEKDIHSPIETRVKEWQEKLLKNFRRMGWKWTFI